MNGSVTTWKAVASILAAIVSTALVGFFAFGVDRPTRQEVYDIIERSNRPIEQRLDRIWQTLQKLDDKVDALKPAG